MVLLCVSYDISCMSFTDVLHNNVMVYSFEVYNDAELVLFSVDFHTMTLLVHTTTMH